MRLLLSNTMHVQGPHACRRDTSALLPQLSGNDPVMQDTEAVTALKMLTEIRKIQSA